jgi:lysophospholipase L1-like esterase
MKPTTLKRLLWISLLLNALLIIGGGVHVLKNRMRTKQESKVMPYWYYKNSSYWQDRKSLFESLPNESGEILFVGDSQTDGCEWCELMGNNKVKNRGIDGDNTEGVLARLDEITASMPAKIFLEIGTNDLALKRSIQKIQQDYSAILIQIGKASPKTKIYIQSVLPRYDDPNRKGGVNNDSIVQLNSLLQLLAQRENATYVDLHRCFVDGSGKLQKELSQDGVHLNAKGYAVWQKQVESLVKEPTF